MIVRISGEGQYELDDGEAVRLDELDTALSRALHEKDEGAFDALLAQTIAHVKDRGKPVPARQVVPSAIVVPPGDVTLAEAERFFTDEGPMEPLPA